MVCHPLSWRWTAPAVRNQPDGPSGPTLKSALRTLSRKNLGKLGSGPCTMLRGVLEWLGLAEGGRGSRYHRLPTSQDLSGRTHEREEPEQPGPDAQRSRIGEVGPSVASMHEDFVQGSAALSLDDEDEAEMRAAVQRAEQGGGRPRLSASLRRGTPKRPASCSSKARQRALSPRRTLCVRFPWPPRTQTLKSA